MQLRHASQQWNEIARLDPLWAVLVEPSRKFGGWETEDARAEFFDTGEREVAQLLHQLDTVAPGLRRGRVLDFGCGVGRLSRALSRHFQECVGVDISEAMVARARELNADRENCTFRVNTEDHLALLETGKFDLVYTSIVLQHVPSRAAIRSYIREFVRVLRPGGVVVFQLPSHIPWRRRIQPRRRLYALLRRLGVGAETLYQRLGLAPMRMNFLPEVEVARLLTGAGARLVDIVRNDAAGPEIESQLYIAVREGAPDEGALLL